MACETPLQWQALLIARLNAAGLPVTMQPLPFLFHLTPSITIAIERAVSEVGAREFTTKVEPVTGHLVFAWQ